MGYKLEKDSCKSKNGGERKGSSSVCYMEKFPEYFGLQGNPPIKDHDYLDQVKPIKPIL